MSVVINPMPTENRNMRTALQHRGKSEVRLAWWNGNADHPCLSPDSLTNAVMHIEETLEAFAGTRV